jgi:formylglycine-generating enzyme required for sulfatase activity
VAGGTFQQGEPDAFVSTIDSFRLDEMEVTVGRFRRFVDGYDAWRQDGNPRAGDGQSSNVAASGWDTSWSTALAPSAAELETSLGCGAVTSTWTEAANDALPITCVDWYTAFAFCIWDGGRLPTDAEAEYAAVGGSADYRYPWGDSPALTETQDASASYAVYYCLADGSNAAGSCSAADVPAVGSRPMGRGHYGQLDLVGSVWEWSLDWWQETYPTTAQSNYAKLDSGSYRSARGGSWDSTAKLVHAAARTGMAPSGRSNTVGVRCARNAL